MVSIFPLWYTLLVVYPFFLHNEHPNQEPKPKGFNTLCNWLIDQCLRYIRFVNVWSIYLLVYPFFLHNEHLNQELNKAKGLNILLHTLISVYVCHMFSSSFKQYLLVMVEIPQPGCTGWTKKKGLLLQTNKHFVFRNYYSVGRRNLSTWSTHEYFLLTNFDVQQNSSF